MVPGLTTHLLDSSADGDMLLVSFFMDDELTPISMNNFLNDSSSSLVCKFMSGCHLASSLKSLRVLYIP